MKKTSDDLKIESLHKEIEEIKAKYLRALADYQNLEKRVNANVSEVKKFAAADFVIKLLPFLDTIEKVDEQYNKEGFDIAIKQLREVLQSEKISKIDVVGKKFDPFYMECIELDKENPGEEVTEELRSGYMLQDKVIRIAHVKVGKIKKEKKD
jgi:molecular chaperone GrpE